MTNQIVIALTGRGANDAPRGLLMEYGAALASIGLSVVYVTIEDAELRYAVEQMAAGNVRFGLTLQGMGQGISVSAPSGESANAWEAL
jgi:hypothetical protein